MDLVAAAVSLITTIVKMIGDAKTASAEKSADIAARFAAAESALAGAADAAHKELQALEDAAKQGG